jgi:hypothetical protein
LRLLSGGRDVVGLHIQQHSLRVTKDRRRFFVAQLMEVAAAPRNPVSLPEFLASPLALEASPAFLPAILSQRVVAQRTLFSWILKVGCRLGGWPGAGLMKLCGVYPLSHPTLLSLSLVPSTHLPLRVWRLALCGLMSC